MSDSKDNQVFQMIQASLARLEQGQNEIRESSRHIERKTADLELSMAKQQSRIDEYARRTEAVENLVKEVRNESKEGIKTLRGEIEEKLRPAAEVASKFTGWHSTTKAIFLWLGGIASATIAIVAVIKMLL